MSNRFTKDYIDSGQSIKSVLGTHVNTFMSVVCRFGVFPFDNADTAADFEKLD